MLPAGGGETVDGMKRRSLLFVLMYDVAPAQGCIALNAVYSFTLGITISSNHFKTVRVTSSFASIINQCPRPSKAMSHNRGMNLYDFWMSGCVHVGSAVPHKKSTGRSVRKLDGRFSAESGIHRRLTQQNEWVKLEYLVPPLV